MTTRIHLPEGHNDTLERYRRQSLECGYREFEDDFMRGEPYSTSAKILMILGLALACWGILGVVYVVLRELW
jgi:hypothetical protein